MASPEGFLVPINAKRSLEKVDTINYIYCGLVACQRAIISKKAGDIFDSCQYSLQSFLHPQ